MDISSLSLPELVRIFSKSVGCSVVLLIVSFALPKIFNFKRFICQLLILEPEPLVFSRKFPPIPMCLRVFPFSFLLHPPYLFLFGDPWTIWTWSLFKEENWINFRSSACIQPIEPALFFENTFVLQLFSVLIRRGKKNNLGCRWRKVLLLMPEMLGDRSLIWLSYERVYHYLTTNDADTHTQPLDGPRSPMEQLGDGLNELKGKASS